MTPAAWNPTEGPARQGDVTLVLVPDMTGAAFAAKQPERLTLARGSASDHGHYIDAVEVRPAQGDQPRRIYVPADAVLRVEPGSSAWRHPAIAVPAGVYDVLGAVEYTPTAFVPVGD